MTHIRKHFLNVKRVLAVAMLCLGSILGGFAQTDTVFWFATPDLEIGHQQTPIQLCFTTYGSAATITVEQPTNSAFPTATFTVPADSFYVLDVSNWVDDIESKPANTVLNRGFRISATDFISCYYESVGNNSEMYTLKGSSGLGTDFLVPMQVAFNSNYTSSTSSIEIIATEDNTVIQITAPVALQGGIAAGSTVTVTLQRGQTYVVRAAGTSATDHLHNTVIHSNKPIVVNSTDDSVASGWGCVDLIGDQLVPINMTGRRYVAIRNYSSYENAFERVFVFPLQNNTTVWFNGVPQTVSQGSFIDHLLTDTATLITSNNPIIAFQITATGCEQGGTMLPHLECTGSYSVSHLRPNIASMIVTLVTGTIHTGNFTLNGNPNAITAADFHPLAADPTLSYCLKDISNIVPTGTVMKLTNSSGRFQLGILDGDNGGSCSYGFFSDYARSSYVQFEMDSLYCVGDSIVFHYSAPNVDNLVLTGPNSLQLTTPPFALANANTSMSGWYYLEGADTSSCYTVLSDSIYIQVVPVSEDTTHLVVETCDSYTWHGTTYTQTGNYTYATATSGGCVGIEMLHLTILPPPVILHTPDTTIQAGDSATLWASGTDVLYWTDANGNILASGPTLTVNPTISTMYYITGQNMGADLSNNLVVNGDFEQGNVNFYSELPFISPCYGCLIWGSYTITTDGILVWGEDHLYGYGGTGQFMLVDGSTTPNAILWQQTVPVTPNTYYAFSTQVASTNDSHNQNSWALLQFSVNGTQLGPIFHSPNVLNTWQPYYEVWYSGNNTSATLTILNQNNNGYGNDFGLDNIVFAPVSTCTAYDSVYVHLPEFPDNVDSADCTFLPEGTGWSISQPIISDIGNAVIVSTPMVGDVDDDGQQEIVIPSATSSLASQLNIYNSDGTLKSQFNIAGTYVWNSIGLAKVRWDNSSYKTIIVVFGANNYLYAYDATGLQLWQSDQPFSSHDGESCKMPAISFADFNHDGWTEVFIGSEIFDAATGVLLCKTNGNKGGADRTWSWANTPYQTMAADLCGDSRLELAVGNAVYDIDIQSRTNFSANSTSVARQVPTSAMNMEDGSQIPFTDGNTFLADINLDGSLDVIVMNVDGNNRIVYIYVWDVATNSIICSKKIPNARKFGTPQIGDLDNDTYPEICFITGTYSDHGTGNNDNIHALKYNPSNSNGSMDLFWSIPHEDNSGSTGLTMFDFNQDGYVELVYRDVNNLRIINGSLYNHQTGQPVTQPYDLAYISCHSATGIEYPVIADVDLDGEVEIIVGGETFSTDYGHVYIFKSAGVPWAPARPVWNQYMYNVTNVNKNLTIPQYLFNNATPFTDPQGVVRRPYNNFLQQATTIDQYGRPFYAVPDVAMDTSASSQMVGDSLVLTFSYCNLGDNTLNAPYPVTVFVNNYGGDTLCTTLVNNSLPKDSCTQSEIRLPLNALCNLPIVDAFVIAVNCAGNGIAQNGSLQPECDTTNNTATVTIHIEPATDSTYISVHACDTLTWNGILYDTTGVYVQTLSNMYGCDSVVVMDLTVAPSSLTLFSDSICQNTAYSGYGFSLSEDETATSGFHTLERTLANQFGCDSIIRLNLYVKPVITPEFYANPDRAMLSENPVIYFVNNTNIVELAQANYYWIWDFGDGASDTTSEAENSHLYTNWGDYTVTLTLWADGCMDSASVSVFIEADLEFPNVITPNGDGINDVFVIKNLNPDRPNRLYITDRWGKAVWHKDNYQTYMKDEQIYNAESGFGMDNISDGVYYYTFYYEGMVRTVKFNGSITVIR